MGWQNSEGIVAELQKKPFSNFTSRASAILNRSLNTPGFVRLSADPVHFWVAAEARARCVSILYRFTTAAALEILRLSFKMSPALVVVCSGNASGQGRARFG